VRHGFLIDAQLKNRTEGGNGFQWLEIISNHKKPWLFVG
jgi:hypothetical protein